MGLSEPPEQYHPAVQFPVGAELPTPSQYSPPGQSIHSVTDVRCVEGL